MTGNDFSSQFILQLFAHGFQFTQVIYVAARLGIADLLKDGSRNSEELAQVTATHPPSLYRILRLLTVAGLLTEEGGSFALTPLGVYLQEGVPGSIRNRVLFFGDKVTWQVWGALLHSVRTGESAYEHVFGLKAWEYRAQHPEAAALLNNTMTEMTASTASMVAAAYDFSAVGTLVDVGGGHGQMLASILQACPTLHGVLFDLPHVVKEASPLLEAVGVSDRCEIVGGDAFTGVPADFGTYLLSQVIHNWDDEHAIAILARCHQAMKPHGKVLLVERVILTEGIPEVLMSDVNMLVMSGGKERTATEYRALLTAAGFELTKLISVLPPLYIIEGVRS